MVSGWVGADRLWRVGNPCCQQQPQGTAAGAHHALIDEGATIGAVRDSQRAWGR